MHFCPGVIHSYGICLVIRYVFLVLQKLTLLYKINFLPVGHTHEDVDQLFSKIDVELRRGGCESLPGRLSRD